MKKGFRRRATDRQKRIKKSFGESAQSTLLASCDEVRGKTAESRKPATLRYKGTLT